MPSRIIKRFGASTLIATCALFAAPAITSAGYLDVRVVDGDGTTLAEYRQITGTTKIKSSKKATCFGVGNEGSGARFKVPGKSVIGSIWDAASHDKSLDPLWITDKFNDSFGPGLCGVDRDQGSGGEFWNLRVNGADGFNPATDPVSNGDEVVARQIASGPPPDFANPEELVLSGPPSAEPGAAYTVTVERFDFEGSSAPAEGAEVIGGAAPADASGEIEVTSPKGVAKLRATLAGATPSNQLDVCVNADPAACGSEENLRINGRPGTRDAIRGGGGNDRIFAFGGKDRINLLDGGRDVVSCGGGEDRVIAARGDRDDHIGRTCERVIRK